MSAESSSPPQVPELKPVFDYPEYWLGQVRIISDMERRGALTRAQMVTEIHNIVDAMAKNEQRKIYRLERILSTK